MSSPILTADFYRREDVVQLSRNLLGKVLCTKIDDSQLTSGIITETEAYCGRNDKACHASDGKRTARTEIMYAAGGRAYIYLCYGIHHLFNVVTNRQGQADAILIRAVKPVDGIKLMQERRNSNSLSEKLTAGPGRLTQALGITTDYTGMDLTGDTVWVEDRGHSLGPDDIKSSPRIGVDYAGEDAKLPWRFYMKDSDWVS